MDSLTQFALGAAVSVAVMRRRMPIWQSALWGGIGGTLPDLDALIDHGDALSNMVSHRAHSHAVIWQSAAAPAIAWLMMQLSRVLRSGDARQSSGPAPHFGHWLAMVWLALVTHALLDGMTIYGTQLARPLIDEAYGLGSIFIIDPLYTLPLIGGVAAAMVSGGSVGLKTNSIGLAASTAYLIWTAIAQHQVTQHVHAYLAMQGTPADRAAVLVTPTPFNSVLWRIVVMRDDRYEEGFYSLFDGGRPIRFDNTPIDRALRDEAMKLASVRSLHRFSDGFMRIDENSGGLRITDLRMGQEPAYVFSFLVARRGSELTEITPRAVGGRGDTPIAEALTWLWKRAGGADIEPPRR
jgi:inner membrane protein